MAISLGIGLGLTHALSKGAGVPEVVRDYLARASPAFSGSQRTRIIRLGRTLQAADMLDRMYLLYLGMAPLGNHASLNLPNAAYDYTISGTSVLDADGAYKSQSSSYIKTGWKAGEAGAALNNFGISVYSDTVDASESPDAFAEGPSGFASLYCRRVGNYANGRVNDASPTAAVATGTVTAGNGHFLIQRTSSSNREVYREGSLIYSTSGASTALPGGELIFLGRPASSLFSPRRLFALCAHEAFTPDEVFILAAALTDYFEDIAMEE